MLNIRRRSSSHQVQQPSVAQIATSSVHQTPAQTSAQYSGGYRKNRRIIEKKWLHDFPNSSPSYIIIGSIGVGKTILSKILLKEAGYDYIYFASSDEKKMIYTRQL